MGQAKQWLTPVNPEFWEAEADGSPEPQLPKIQGLLVQILCMWSVG